MTPYEKPLCDLAKNRLLLADDGNNNSLSSPSAKIETTMKLSPDRTIAHLISAL
jgi:hypothetical protein